MGVTEPNGKVGKSGKKKRKKKEKKKRRELLELSGVKIDRHHDYKMVFVVNHNLKMTKGKIAAQCAHAAIDAYTRQLVSNPRACRSWRDLCGAVKIALRGDSADHLLRLCSDARENGVNAAMVSDAGCTQVPSGSITCVALGPDQSEIIDMITGSLKLL